MAKYRFRGILNAAQYPMLAGIQGRTIINPAIDPNVRTPRGFSGSEESLDVGVPQIVYCENVVPTAEGLQSVGYQQLVGQEGSASDFDQVIVLRDPDENNTLFVPSNGKNWILDPLAGTWSSVDPIVGLPDETTVTRAYVNGRTFVCYAGDNIYEYDATAGTFLPVVGLSLPPGVALTDIRGVAGSNNYLLFWTSITVYWSSLVDPVDFVPSLTTGASFATPQDVRGPITVIVASSGGFIIYTNRNAVAATYTNNSRAPFVFREIANAGGVLTPEQVTSDQNSGTQYAWTTSGFQKITLQGSEFANTEISDFIAGRVDNRWDRSTKLMVQSSLNTLPEFYTKVVLIASRFLVLSYGSTKLGSLKVFNNAILYDLSLKRLGKFTIEHTDCFAFQLNTAPEYLTYDDLGTKTYDDLGFLSYDELVVTDIQNVDPTSKRTVAFLKATGEIQLALMDYDKTTDHDAVLILGKHQLLRANWITHQLTTIEGAYGSGDTDEFNLEIAKSLDGYNMEAAVPAVLLKNNSRSKQYGKRLIGLNFNLVITGTFALSSYVTEANDDGSE